MKTLALYEKTAHGLLRIGTFTPKSLASTRELSEKLIGQYPGLRFRPCYVARRMRLFGKVVDSSDLIQLETGAPASSPHTPLAIDYAAWRWSRVGQEICYF